MQISPGRTKPDPSGRGQRDYIPEAVREVLALVFLWGGWLGDLGLLIWVTVNYNPAEGKIAPIWVGYLFIGLMGVAISGAFARSRMRITATIDDAIRAGMAIQRQLYEAGRPSSNDSAE